MEVITVMFSVDHMPSIITIELLGLSLPSAN